MLWQVGVVYRCDNGEFCRLIGARESCPDGSPVLVKAGEDLTGVVDEAPNRIGDVENRQHRADDETRERTLPTVLTDGDLRPTNLQLELNVKKVQII